LWIRYVLVFSQQKLQLLKTALPDVAMTLSPPAAAYHDDDDEDANTDSVADTQSSSRATRKTRS
jgi:hypothetical protein